MPIFKRKIVAELHKRCSQKPKFIQIILGPRQVGKTTSVKQLQSLIEIPVIYSAADTVGMADSLWIQTKWHEARALLNQSSQALLILDEVQSVDNWQRVVKGLWDEDRSLGNELHVIITGSSSLLLKKGSESLAGRFEKHELYHWSFSEMQQAFSYNLSDFILKGGYPGTVALSEDEERWKEYIKSSLIDSVLTKDIISLSRITKPSLLKQMFILACSHPAEIVSYNKFLGQLVDVGNVTTLSDYRELLEDAFLFKVLNKWSGSTIASRASKPKWIIRDNSLVTALSSMSFSQIQSSILYGHLVENAVISHLLKIAPAGYYWREDKYEVDYVFEFSGKIYALEIKAGERLRSKNGLKHFLQKYPKAIALVIGADGLPLEKVLLSESWLW